MANIGERIKKIRKEAGLSQVDFAESIDVTQGFLSGLEKGRYQPTADTLICITNIYKIDATWLLTGEEKTIVAEESPPYRKVDPRIAAMTANFEALSEDDKKAIEQIAATLAQSQKINKKAG